MNPSPSNAVGWFEIPVTDMSRAIEFYESVFEVKLEKVTLGPLEMAVFPMEEEAKGSSGALVKHPQWYKPSDSAGVLVYFTAKSGDVSIELGRVEKAGGKILQPKKSIGEHGFVAFFLDSEGNRIALHSRT